MSEEHLLSCAHCGSDRVSVADDCIRYVWVQCLICGMQTPPSENENSVRALWNRRVLPLPPPEVANEHPTP